MSANSRSTNTIQTKTAELALAVPQVMAHRLTRMAMAGPMLSRRDHKEFALMYDEKNMAFFESWQAMMAAALHANQELMLTVLRNFWSPASWGKPMFAMLSNQTQRAAMDIVAKGLAPVHGTAVANARRLGRTTLR